jgi:hypothetical protein
MRRSRPRYCRVLRENEKKAESSSTVPVSFSANEMNINRLNCRKLDYILLVELFINK